SSLDFFASSAVLPMPKSGPDTANRDAVSPSHRRCSVAWQRDATVKQPASLFRRLIGHRKGDGKVIIRIEVAERSTFIFSDANCVLSTYDGDEYVSTTERGLEAQHPAQASTVVNSSGLRRKREIA